MGHPMIIAPRDVRSSATFHSFPPSTFISRRTSERQWPISIAFATDCDHVERCAPVTMDWLVATHLVIGVDAVEESCVWREWVGSQT